jgi:hypothetical protein
MTRTKRTTKKLAGNTDFVTSGLVAAKGEARNLKARNTRAARKPFETEVLSQLGLVPVDAPEVDLEPTELVERLTEFGETHTMSGTVDVEADVPTVSTECVDACIAGPLEEAKSDDVAGPASQADGPAAYERDKATFATVGKSKSEAARLGRLVGRFLRAQRKRQGVLTAKGEDYIVNLAASAWHAAQAEMASVAA